MPYQKSTRTFRIIFDSASKPDTSLAGLEVIAKAIKFGKVFELAELEGLSGARMPTEEDKKIMGIAIGKLMESLVSWDMTDENGDPVPLDRAAIDDLDIDQGIELMEEWSDVIMGNVSQGKAKNSAGGQKSVEGSIPMEPLS